MTPDLVIFDCDGVLVNSEPMSNRVMADAITRAGYSITGAEAQRRWQGKLLSDIGADIKRQTGRRLPPSFWPEFETARNDAFTNELEAIPGAEQAIENIRAAGVRVCVASQAKRAKTELTLSHTGLRRFFADAQIFSAYEVERPKPFPDLFLTAAAMMGVPAERCVVVEDSPSGMRAGLAANMRVIAYVAPDASRQGIDTVEIIDAMSALPLLLEINPTATR